MKKKEFKNYILLNKVKDGGSIEIIRADATETSDEIGFRISGVATTFNVRNENGGLFQTGDFDKTIREYFKKNGINMICPIEHEYSFDNRGVFEMVENTDETLNVSAIFYKDCCSKYDIIKNQVLRGILQGFSTYGWVWENGDVFLDNIALVANPADTGSKLFRNTKYIGFEEKEAEPDEPTEIEDIFLL